MARILEIGLIASISLGVINIIIAVWNIIMAHKREKDMRAQRIYGYLISTLKIEKTRTIYPHTKDGECFEMHPLVFESLQGIPKKIVQFVSYYDMLNNLQFKTHKRELKLQEVMDVRKKQKSPLFQLELNQWFAIDNQFQGEHLLYSSSFYQVEDFLGNTDWYMVIHLFNSETKKALEQFVFTKEILICEGQRDFFVPYNDLGVESQEEFGFYLQYQVDVFKKLMQRINEIDEGDV